MKIAIVDDEKDCRDRLKKLIHSQWQDEIIIDEFSSGEMFLELENKKYDILFLDIEMSGLTGIEVGEEMRKRGSTALLFYVTAHNSYISDALRNQPFQYLIKPVQKDIFIKDFNRAKRQLYIMHQSLKLEWKGAVTKIEIGHITYIEYVDRKTKIYTDNGETYYNKGTIKEFVEHLHEYNFVQCHKSFIINLKFISEIGNTDIVLGSGAKIPLSKNYKPNLKRRLNLYLAGVTV
ncbi:MAG: LytTR family DNA-binding domain-containing protein [Clostridia bacterium]